MNNNSDKKSQCKIEDNIKPCYKMSEPTENMQSTFNEDGTNNNSIFENASNKLDLLTESSIYNNRLCPSTLNDDPD